MATDKKSFIAYCDWKETFDSLPNEKAGELIKHIFSYVSDENPQTDDVLINAVFANIKHTLKRDLKKWEKQHNQRVKAGQKSAEVRKRNATTVNERSVSSTVSVSVSGSVNEEEVDSVSAKAEVFERFWNMYNKKTSRKKCETKFNKLSTSDKDKIFSTLPNYIKLTPDPQYRKDPSTYLNNESWNDEGVAKIIDPLVEQAKLINKRYEK